LDDSLTASVKHARPDDNVIGFGELAALLNLEQARDLVGCDDVRCTAEIGLALDADLLVLAAHGRFGQRRVATLKLLDVKEATVVERIQTTLPADEQLPATVDRMVRWLFLSVGDRALARNEALDQWGERLRELVHGRCAEECTQWTTSRRGDIEFLLEDKRLPVELSAFRPLLRGRLAELTAAARRDRLRERGPMVRTNTLRRGRVTQRWVTIEPEP
ncbi:MAG: hypothetical protein AAFX94_19660, partial [Myxococcota bacterium]